MNQVLNLVLNGMFCSELTKIEKNSRKNYEKKIVQQVLPMRLSTKHMTEQLAEQQAARLTQGQTDKH